MQEVYAALLLHSAGKAVDEGGLKKVLDAAGTQTDEARVKALVSSLKDVNIDEAIKQSVVTAAVAAPAAGGGEPKKEEKKEDDGKKAEEAASGLAGLFG
ncbi:MAG TPA: 50S ribosomal protein P1 [archaeon]|nr:50S ribosomal protein P1 [archaeon]